MGITRKESTTGHAIDPHGVNHARHYNLHPSGIEAIEVIRYMGFNVGSAFKYLFRSGHKGALLQDVEKALWYLRDEINYGEPLPRAWSDRTWSNFCKVCASEPDSLVRFAFACMAEYSQHGSTAGLVKAADTVSAIRMVVVMPVRPVEAA